MTPDTIRQRFLDFFEERDHRVVDSSPVVPQGDPTLLFTNAGMNQFKDLLLGNETRDYKRATSAQKCIRAGGKHNDLDEVGRDGRHLTFFEMLGNWSFGDYYKRQAIEWAWEFVLEELDLNREQLYVTVYKDDDESYDIWVDDIGIPEERIIHLGDIEEGNEENFWSMGPTGPCGPCTEIHYDLRPDEPFEFAPGYDEDRVVEIWNLVFMEFNRDETGEFHPLPMKSVDTGMGLDRVAMIKAGAENVFQTDLFSPIFQKTAELLGEPITHWEEFYESDDFSSYAVIADHIRSLAFAICDGAQFSNEGRGYVLRRILRRAVRFGRTLGFTEPFLCEVIDAVVDHYGDVYPELEAMGDEAAQLIRLEEERFFRNIDRGLDLFEEAAESAEQEGRDALTGREVFELHATYGFPPDLTEIMAEERDLGIAWSEYEELWEQHQEASKGKDVYDETAGVGDWETLHDREGSQFVGYDEDTAEGCDPRGFQDQSLRAETVITRYYRDDDGDYQILLDETPFYAESGGQVGDTGTISTKDGTVVFEVEDTQETPIGIVHFAELLEGEPSRNNLEKNVVAQVDSDHRRRAASNHTATHLLHYALRNLVSDSIFQSGSLVAPDRLRFDFSHEKPVSPEQLEEIERWVNEVIQKGVEITVHPNVERDHAVEDMGAMAIFGEKYGDRVRVIEIEDDDIDFESVELCGGTHVENTRDINVFRITRESSVAAGIRRIEAVTGREAYESFRQDSERLSETADILKTDPANLIDTARSKVDQIDELERQVDKLSQKLAHARSGALVDEAVDVDGVSVVAAQVDVATRDQLLTFADRLREQLDSGAALLGAEIDGSAALVALVTDDLVDSRGLKAGDLVGASAEHVGGGGGGRPTLAQAGGPDADGISAAIEAFEDLVRETLED
jgi:alanyl-tRNA synthetase